MGYITIPEFTNWSAKAFLTEGLGPDLAETTFKTKVIEVPDVKVAWVPGVSYQGVYRVSIRYRNQVYNFSFTPEAIPVKASGIQPFINQIAKTLQKMASIDEEAMPWFSQELIGKCFPGQKPSDWPDLEPKPDFMSMATELPVDLDQKVGCPRCGRARKKTTLGDVIIHLNDRHKMTRENIAKWLDDEADAGRINIDFKTPEEQEREKNERARQKDSGSKSVDADASYSFLKSGLLSKDEFDEIFNNWKKESLGVWDKLADGSGSGKTDNFPTF